MSRIDEIKGRLSKIDTNMSVYRCAHYMDEDEACGIYEGQSLDYSYDECHHPLSRDLAEYIINTPADIQYLLSKLEIAENELNKIWSLSNGVNANEIIIRQKAEEALQQIRS